MTSRRDIAFEKAREAGIAIMGHQITTDREGLPLVVVRGTRGVDVKDRTIFLLVAFREDGKIDAVEAGRSEARWVKYNSFDGLAARRQRKLTDHEPVHKPRATMRSRFAGDPQERESASGLMKSGQDSCSGRYYCPWCGARQMTHRSGRREYICGSWVDRILGTHLQSEKCKVHGINREERA